MLATCLSEVQDRAAPKNPTRKEVDHLYEERMVRGSRNKYCQEMSTRFTKPEVFSPGEHRLA